ncbi:MAG TPA: glycoside hydrolase family 15 protein [Gemmatimonadales bacterium]|nr:glycoside hydrolase family 15 protein [Gemmatimonadales bacterium]
MPRDLPLSNGRLLVAFGRDYLIHDIYFPHVGKENHATGHPFRVGVWTSGAFSWLGPAPEWQLDRRYSADSMVTDVRARNEALGVELVCHDAVDFYENVLVRHLQVSNLQDREREIRLFFHHDFHIRGNEIGDTAHYSPETQALIHYKDDRYFLMNCAVGGDTGVRRYACGQKEVAGAEGTWRDAEDGELQGNPIAQGSVDSTLGLSLIVAARGAAEADYWMAAGRDFREVATIDKVVRDKTPGELLRRTRNYWRLWVRKDRRGLDQLPELVAQRYSQSLLIIRSQIDHEGAITAANDTDIVGFARDTYSYMWPRDGALVAAALLRGGHVGAPEKFLEFCAKVISPLGYVRHKYNPDGTLASSWHGYVREGKPVLPIQEDETALIIWALWQFFELYQPIEETAPFYRALVTRPADFLLGYVDTATGLPLPSHDLWEERWGVHTFTVAAVIAGLRAAARVCDAFGESERATRYVGGAERMRDGLRAVLWNEREQRFARMAAPGPNGYTLDMTVDSSLFGLVELGALPPDDPHLEATLRQVEERLWVHTDVGGLARYENDAYYQVERADTKRVPGNPWFISTLWLARYRLLQARTSEDLAKGLELIEWAARRALPSGVMAEQLHPYTGEPLSVSPLTWSQAAYVRVVREYLDRTAHLNRCPTCGHQTGRKSRLTDRLAAIPDRDEPARPPQAVESEP